MDRHWGGSNQCLSGVSKGMGREGGGGGPRGEGGEEIYKNVCDYGEGEDYSIVREEDCAFA